MAKQNVLLWQDIETPLAYTITNEHGVEKARQRGVRLNAGTIYTLDDDATVARLLALKYGEISVTAGVEPD